MALRAMKGGAIDFFTKPIDDAALLKSVARAFQQVRANRQAAIEHEKFVARFETLAPREREVRGLLVRGLLSFVGSHISAIHFGKSLLRESPQNGK